MKDSTRVIKNEIHNGWFKYHHFNNLFKNGVATKGGHIKDLKRLSTSINSLYDIAETKTSRHSITLLVDTVTKRINELESEG